MPRRPHNESWPPPPQTEPAAEAPARPALQLLRANPTNLEPPLPALDSFLTPAELRFVRAHFQMPQVDAATHVLTVSGAVANPLRLSLDDLRALPQRSMTATTECAGNTRLSLAPPPPGEPWIAGAVATAQWTGVPLTEVIERCGLREDALELLFTGQDEGMVPGHGHASYARALPRAKALEPDVLLALEMNGAPIWPEHGGPLRLIVPDWYGMASVKWLVRIEALTAPFTGHFQAEHYLYIEYGAVAKVTRMRVKSIITSPAAGAVIAREPQVVRGFAWSGEGGIERVEVAFGGGHNWREATLTGPALPHAWRAFEMSWEPRAPGRHLIRSRATDTRGNRQPVAPRWNEQGYGANGVQTVVVQVR